MSLITLKNLNKTYNKGTDASVQALNDLSLTIEHGDLIAVVGASGSGKSTLLHILACLDQDFEGSYQLDETDIHTLSAPALAKIRNHQIGIVLQNFGLISDMTVFDNVALPIYLSGERYNTKQLQQQVKSLLSEVGIVDKIQTKTSQLSGGQKQRVAIARALINNPSLILADEPTGALDQKTSEEIMNILVKLNASGHTIILVTHDMNVAAKCKNVITISDGKIV